MSSGLRKMVPSLANGPGIIGPCCHGPDEAEVYRQLCEIVEEWLDLARQDGKPLPPPTAGKNVARLIA